MKKTNKNPNYPKEQGINLFGIAKVANTHHTYNDPHNPTIASEGVFLTNKNPNRPKERGINPFRIFKVRNTQHIYNGSHNPTIASDGVFLTNEETDFDMVMNIVSRIKSMIRR